MADDVPTATGAAAAARDETLLRAIEVLVRRGDELHARRVAELQKALAALHDVLRVLAAQAIKLADIRSPSDPADAAIVAAVIAEAREVLAFVEPPKH